MDRYQRVEKPRPETAIKENEIRITTQGLIRNYISYAMSLLQEKRAREIVLKAMGQAISKTVAIAEIIKKKIPGLHQDISISSTSITDVWEPIEEGLVPLELTRHVSMITISLSTKELNKTSPGYQAPLYVEETKHQYQRQAQYQQVQSAKQVPAPMSGPYEDTYGRGRGRGGGRGRGWGTGRYNGYQENGDWNYNNWNQGGGRGRGWGYRGGYERGRGDSGRSGRGYGQGRGRMGGGRGRGGGYQD